MLYAILKTLFRITFNVFFRSARRHGVERLPDEGPLLICANHPGAFLDPVVIAALTKRRVHFLAKGAVFKGKLGKWMLPKMNVIPVYRQQDDPSQMHKNKETFIRCYEHLGKGGAILIFPEGVSITERKLRPLKTGAARIVLGAEEQYGYKLGVKVICVGLNYEDPHTFHRDMFISYSEPIDVQQYTEKYKTEGFAAAEALTEEIRRRLEDQLIHIADEETDRLVADIERLHKHDLLKERGISKDDKQAEFELTKRIVQTVNHFREKDPERVARISAELKNYFRKLEELGLSDRVVRGGQRGGRLRKNLKELLFIVFGFPVYVFGLLHNYLPFISASLIAKKLVKQIEFRGAVGAAAGMLLFLIWYTTLAIASWKFLHTWAPFDRPGWTFLLYFISWPATGLFAWYYYRSVYYISKRWLMMSLFYKRTSLIAELVLQREKLVKEFEKAVEERGVLVSG